MGSRSYKNMSLRLKENTDGGEEELEKVLNDKEKKNIRLKDEDKIRNILHS